MLGGSQIPQPRVGAWGQGHVFCRGPGLGSASWSPSVAGVCCAAEQRGSARPAASACLPGAGAHPRCPLPFREDIWFDDVDPEDIEAAMGPEAARIARSRLGLKESLVKEQAFGGYEGGGCAHVPRGGGLPGAPDAG